MVWRGVFQIVRGEVRWFIGAVGSGGLWFGEGEGSGQVCHGLKGSISDCQGRSQVVHWGAVGSGGLGYGEGEGSGQVCHGLKGSISDNQGRSQVRSGLERWLMVWEGGGSDGPGTWVKIYGPSPPNPLKQWTTWPLWFCGQMDRKSENITFPRTIHVVGKNVFDWWYSYIKNLAGNWKCPCLEMCAVQINPFYVISWSQRVCYYYHSSSPWNKILADRGSHLPIIMSKQLDWPYVINLGNSILGVSILAMPFCFRQVSFFQSMLLVHSEYFNMYKRFFSCTSKMAYWMFCGKSYIAFCNQQNKIAIYCFISSS